MAMTELDALVSLFVRAAAPTVPSPSAVDLHAYVAAARTSWPAFVELSDEALVQHAAARCDDKGLSPAQHAGDRLLALGCLERLPAALAAFEQLYGELITRVLRHRGAAPAEADDVAQTVRERLLLGSAESPAQLAGYRGAGPLRSWVAIATSTQLAMARRSENRRREQPASEASGEGNAADLIAGDPELRYLRDRYRVEAEQAIVHALQTLGDRERVLLRLQLGDRLTLEQLAGVYSVSRATVVRWLAKARSELLAAIRTELAARTGAAPDTCDSLLRLVHSQLDVSVLRHLT
jgi:RNA polymerase sigma-70 factor (ECF subfamily)